MGKIAILGLGFGVGGVKYRESLKTEANVEVTEIRAKEIVQTYRNKYSRIKGFWGAVESVLEMVKPGKKFKLALPHAGVTIEFGWEPKIKGAYIKLPSGRRMHYPKFKPLEYSGVQNGRPIIVELYGGLITENIVQGVSRDIMAHCMLTLPYDPVLTVHDEIVWEMVDMDLKKLRKKILGPGCPAWFPPNLLELESSITSRYGK